MMSKGQLYFLSNQYYLDFPDDKLMKNKDMIGGLPHNCPFLYFPRFEKSCYLLDCTDFFQIWEIQKN